MISPGNQERVAAFMNVLDKLRQDVNQGLNLHTAIVTTRMTGQINTLCEFLLYAMLAVF